MEFHYRGVVYNSEPDAVETVESNVVGHYRGSTWRMRQAKGNVHSDHSGARIKYRGAWVR
ncbi:MAG: DUF4278 domain-containing protein [Leptolyngbyaceae bacterium]|nr:DUF4278 domain-containing protein [Leptolyngbyaceae bacterium]